MHKANFRFLAAAAASLSFLNLHGSPAAAEVVLDDFSGPFEVDGGLSVDTRFPVLLGTQQIDTASPSGATRLVVLDSVPSTDEVLAGPLDGNASLTASNGTLTLNATGDGAPFLLLSYTGADDDPSPQPVDPNLSLDLTGETGLELRYTSNADVQAELTLLNFVPGSATFEGGNSTTVQILAGQSTLFVPFDAFVTPITTTDFSSFPTTVTELPGVDLSSVDGVSFLINPIADATVPTSLTLSLDRVAFVPEPATAAMCLTGLMLLAGRRRRSIPVRNR